MYYIVFIAILIQWGTFFSRASEDCSPKTLERALKHFSLLQLYSGFYLLRLNLNVRVLSKKILCFAWVIILIETICVLIYYLISIFNIYNTMKVFLNFFFLLSWGVILVSFTMYDLLNLKRLLLRWQKKSSRLPKSKARTKK